MTNEPADREEVTARHPTKAPPTRLFGILGHLGPGLIIAGSIVGSGELIATTKTGAEAGFALLWLILIGCVIKVFVQVEMGRFAVVNGRSTMDGLSEVPGPRIRGHGNWLVWYWAVVFVATIGQQGGIVGGVGQALQISAPLTEQGRRYNAQVELETQYKVASASLKNAEHRGGGTRQQKQKTAEQLAIEVVTERIQAAAIQLQETSSRANVADLQDAFRIARTRVAVGKLTPEEVFSASGPDAAGASPETRALLPQLGRLSSHDDKWWALLVAIITSAVLVVGRYGLIQSFSTVMVASFTFITIVNLAMLQATDWSVSAGEILEGLSFRLPQSTHHMSASVSIATALAAFGIIGVGANELIAYPYWCLEKGYAQFTGSRDASPEWAERARGWMRVMRWDAWCSMAVYTFATLAFYLLGAAILWRSGLNPEKSQMIRTLEVMYEPVFGEIARWVFLFGAFAVLYSTFFVAIASLARIVPDAMRALGFGPRDEAGYRRWVRICSGLFPFLAIATYTILPTPAALVLIGGVMQGIMLPMLAGAALYFRYRRNDPRVSPGFAWDFLLWISAVGMLVTGVWTAWAKLAP
jgi:Mn2+/Fe2+ NRAMP family transporter